MSTPVLKGIHHIKLPVTDIVTSLAWYQRVFGAEHLDHFDHYDDLGTRYAIILQLPGLEPAVELRLAPHAVEAIRGYDPVSFTAGSDGELQAWVAHLDALGVRRSPIIRGLGARLVVFTDPDGTYLRLLTLPVGGLTAIEMDAQAQDATGPWLAPAIMHR